MASETYMVLTLTLDRLDLPDEAIGQSEVVTVGGARQGGVLTVTTSETALQVDDSIVVPGLCYVRNYSDTPGQYVSMGYLPGQAWHHVHEGETGLIPLHPGQRSLYLKASSGSVKFEYEITERTGVLSSYGAVDSSGNNMVWSDGSDWTWTQ